MEHLPIIDMHLHASELEPGAIEPLTGLCAPDPPEQYMRDTINLLKELNIRGVTSGPKELVQQ